MKALVFHGRGDIRYEENWPDPAPPTADEVTIAVSWCAICGTDIEDYTHGGIIPIGTPHPTSGRMAPLVFGHEFVGRVAEVGKNVKHLRPGQKVAVECVVGCGKCYCVRKARGSTMPRYGVHWAAYRRRHGGIRQCAQGELYPAAGRC